MRYRKRPVVVEARRVPDWEPGVNITPVLKEYLALAKWCGGTPLVGDALDPREEGIYIPTLEGEMWAAPGDWIIQGVAGEFYPCKPHIFDATYEPVEA